MGAGGLCWTRRSKRPGKVGEWLAEEKGLGKGYLETPLDRQGRYLLRDRLIGRLETPCDVVWAEGAPRNAPYSPAPSLAPSSPYGDLREPIRGGSKGEAPLLPPETVTNPAKPVEGYDLTRELIRPLGLGELLCPLAVGRSLEGVAPICGSWCGWSTPGISPSDAGRCSVFMIAHSLNQLQDRRFYQETP